MLRRKLLIFPCTVANQLGLKLKKQNVIMKTMKMFSTKTFEAANKTLEEAQLAGSGLLDEKISEVDIEKYHDSISESSLDNDLKAQSYFFASLALDRSKSLQRMKESQKEAREGLETAGTLYPFD